MIWANSQPSSYLLFTGCRSPRRPKRPLRGAAGPRDVGRRLPVNKNAQVHPPECVGLFLHTHLCVRVVVHKHVHLRSASADHAAQISHLPRIENPLLIVLSERPPLARLEPEPHHRFGDRSAPARAMEPVAV